jgi:hypothetical protein
MFLIKVIFIVIVIYYVLKSIGKLFLPFLVNQAAQKINNQQSYRKRPEGEISIQYHDSKKDKNPPKVGEYVDFEEIKD